jgi:hypothetical protein
VPPDFLNSREDALLLCVVAILGFAVYKSPRDIGRSVLGVLRALFGFKLLLVFGSAALYSAALIFGAETLGIWHTTAIKETVYWFVGTGVILVGNAISWAEKPLLLRMLLKQGLKLTIIVEFLVNLYVLPLAAELVLIPIALMFAGIEAIASNDPSLASARRATNFVLTAIGLSLLLYAAVSALTDLDAFLTRENSEDFLVGPAMTVALMPLLCGIAAMVGWEMRNLRRRLYPNLDSPA